MDFREDTWYSERVGRYMNIKVYGWGGTPMLGIPCQDSMSNNYADFGMIDTISDYINDGRIQFFCVDTVDKDSWSDLDGDKGHRAWMQEMYFQYILFSFASTEKKMQTSLRILMAYATK